MLYAEIDELTPCLVDVRTGEQIETKVVRIVKRSFLQNYTKSKMWYTNWTQELSAGHEVYALLLKKDNTVQGLISLHDDPDMKAIFMDWACVHPDNNKKIQSDIKYKGVGGHLFAIAAQKSIEYGRKGHLVGYAANRELVDYYCKAFDAEWIGALHPFHIAIDGRNAKKLLEVYTYEWSEEEL